MRPQRPKICSATGILTTRGSDLGSGFRVGFWEYVTLVESGTRGISGTGTLEGEMLALAVPTPITTGSSQPLSRIRCKAFCYRDDRDEICQASRDVFDCLCCEGVIGMPVQGLCLR